MDQILVADDKVQAWTDALRSGEYPQGRGALRTPGGYCCLGVWCDLADPEGWDGDVHRGNKLYPTPDIAPLSDDAIYLCANLNDHGATFAEIAEYIPLFHRGLPADWFVQCAGFVVLPAFVTDREQPGPYLSKTATPPVACWRSGRA